MTNNNGYNPFLVRVAFPLMCDKGITHYLFEVVVSPISIDVHKGGIQDYIITISRPDSCKQRILNTIYKTEEI